MNTLYEFQIFSRGGDMSSKISRYGTLEGGIVFSLGLMTKDMAREMSSYSKDRKSLRRIDLSSFPEGKSKSFFECFSPYADIDCHATIFNRYVHTHCYDKKVYDSIWENFGLNFHECNDNLTVSKIFTQNNEFYCCIYHNTYKLIGYMTREDAERIAIENGCNKNEVYVLDNLYELSEEFNDYCEFDPVSELYILNLEKNGYKVNEDMPNKMMSQYAIDIYKKRCRILALIKYNDIFGLGLCQYEIAKQTNSSTGLVSKINTLYSYNNQIDCRDLWWSDLGRKPQKFNRISEDVFNELCELFSTKGPLELNIPFRSWSAKAILYFLKLRNIDVPLSYIYRFCKKTHLTSKFGTRKNPKQDDSKVLIFTTEGFKRICEVSKNENREIVFIDQCHIQIDHRSKGYSLVNTPTICSYDQSLAHSNYTICTFIGINGFFKSIMIKGAFTSEKLIDCLLTIRRENKNKKFCFIMDNSPVHTSLEACNWYFSNKKFCSVYYLPPYAPKLNVVEFWNNVFKEELKKSGVITNQEMVEFAEQCINRYNSKSDTESKIIKALFLKKECSYIKTIYDQVNNESDLHNENVT